MRNRLTPGLALAAITVISNCRGAEQNINPGNVTRLKVAWIYRTGEPLTPVAGGGKAPAFEATAVYENGLLYIGTPYGRAIAIDPLTGKERWSFDAHINLQGNYGDFANRGVTAWTDAKSPAGAACARRIFFASVDARLFSLDAMTGRPCEEFAEKG